ncbi:uncharacterized protein YlxP (DUF503 family) [Caldicoprobacter guelmensis]|uniref:DUF503 domain-containing protein n=1 Tax=Caldicoprobacter guelmensis TaxID=1170224 RepID=UPI00195C67F5|nr:DUF503 domain-containing protein [Caldicoprobacter guelmensis]MBM7583154.1 uncharacterized protein YlxP (DUF503 family) [Caldicoprobacter guelmensis]
MVIGVCKVNLLIEEAFSLKEKRRILKSLIERLQSRFNASVAEVGLNDKWQSAVLGIACVSNEGQHVDRMLSNIIEFVENDSRVFITDFSTEKIYI